MPKLLELTVAQRAKIQRLYLQGRGPAEIALSLKASGLDLTGKQISNLAIREKWTQQKGEVAQASQKSVKEALESVRASIGPEVEDILLSVFADLKNDAQTLRAGGMDLAEDAAGVSSVQRGKKLLLERLFKLAGLDVQTDANGAPVATIAMIYGRPLGLAPRSDQLSGSANPPDLINVTGTTVAAGTQSTSLDFDDDDHT